MLGKPTSSAPNYSAHLVFEVRGSKPFRSPSKARPGGGLRFATCCCAYAKANGRPRSILGRASSGHRTTATSRWCGCCSTARPTPTWRPRCSPPHKLLGTLSRHRCSAAASDPHRGGNPLVAAATQCRVAAATQLMRPRPGRDPARSVSGMAAIPLQPGACSAGLMHGPAPPLCLPPALSPRLASLGPGHASGPPDPARATGTGDDQALYRWSCTLLLVMHSTAGRTFDRQSNANRR